MIIKERFKNHSDSYISTAVILLFSYWGILFVVKPEHPADRVIAIIIVVPIILTCIRTIGLCTIKFYITKNGIYVTWFGKRTIVYNWSSFQVVRRAKCVTYGFMDVFYEGVLCSKTPPKYVKESDGQLVDGNWIYGFRQRNDVILIDLRDMTPEQYEEFWTYVPGRFKPSA